MNLHICTISCRNDFLEQIYKSIPKAQDIIWHIARAIGNPVQLPDTMKEDTRIQVHTLTCEDIDTPFKMNYIFDQIKHTDLDSYFCILDDDTVFHPGMYNNYLQYIDKQFMVIGQQMDKNYVRRLQGTLPYECAIDAGNVLCHSSVLEKEIWPGKHWDEQVHIDFEFWNNCFSHFGIKQTEIVTDVVSIYNYFSDKPDTLDYVR